MAYSDTSEDRVATLHDMAEHEHIEVAYRLMAAATDHTVHWEQQGINASLAVAHLLLASDKQRDARSTRHGRR